MNLKFLKKHKYFFLIILFSLVPLSSIFVTENLIHTHDGLVQLPRLAAYFKALSDGHFPVRWAGYLNYGYGLPLFNFIYHVPYLAGSAFLVIGFSLVNSFKLSLALGFILSGVFMYLFGKRFFGDARKGFLIAIAYQFMPFHLVEVLTRGSFGSIYAYAFLPLTLYALYGLIKKSSFKNFFLTAVSVFLLVYSHNSLSLSFFGAIFLFALFFAKGKTEYFRAFSALIYGLILSAFYWMPALLEHKYTYGDLLMRNLYKDHFAPLSDFLIPNIINNPSAFFEGVNLSIGLFHLLAVVIAIALLFAGKMTEKQDRKLSYYALSLILIGFFFMTSISRFIWDLNISSFLRQFQFPWRFLSLTVFATSILFVGFLYYPKFKQKYSYAGLIFFIVLITVFMWKPTEGYDKIDEKYYWNFPLNTTYYGETDVIWSAGPAKDYPKKRIEIIGGDGEIADLIVKNHYQKFEVSSEESLGIVSHVQYFPGWRVYVDGNQVPIEFQDPNNRGEITFNTSKGVHNVLIKFEESALRFIADVISLAGFILFIPLFYVYKKMFKE